MGTPWSLCSAFTFLYFLALALDQVSCDDKATLQPNDAPPIDLPEDDLSRPEIASNRVLPVDADHRTKIAPPLEPHCLVNIRENLKKFLKRHPLRKGRQDEDDDGEGEGLAGLLGNLGEGNGALSTLQQIPAVLPQLVTTLTQLSGAVNQGLNGTDTPNIPSFLIRQGMEAVKFFQALSGAANAGHGGAASRLPGQVHVQPIPAAGAGGAAPRPQAPYEPYPSQLPGSGSLVPGSLGTGAPLPPGVDPEDYIDEDVRQPLQPTLAPLIRPGAGGVPGSAGAGAYNPYIQNANLAAGAAIDPAAAGIPQGTSLWNIYKSFRTRPEGVNGTLTDFQLAHPEAFSNELLQSISQAITSIRGQMGNLEKQQVPTDKPSSEIFKQFYPASNDTKPPPPPSIFSSLHKPTLSVYKPKDTVSGVGVDLTNLALNASGTLNFQKPTKEAEDTSLEETTTPLLEAEGDLEGAEGTKSPIKPGATLVGAGSLEKLQQQQQGKPGGPQFVKSPTSSHLTLAMGEYVPAVSSLHEAPEDLQSVGPQQTAEDQMNGFGNKAPYTPVLNGILLEAPRLTPRPSIYQKRPSNLVINTENTTPVTFEERTPLPSFHFQVNQVPPNYHGPDPTSGRPNTLVAAIPSKFEYDRQNAPIQAGSGVVPPGAFAPVTNAVPQSDVWEATTPELQQEEVTTPLNPPPPPPTRRVSQAQINAQRLLAQLLLLQNALQRQQQMKLQQNFNILQNAYDKAQSDGELSTTTTTTPTPPPPPPPPKLAALNALPTQLQQGFPGLPPPQVGSLSPGFGVPPPAQPARPSPNRVSGSIASFANALVNNYSPTTGLITPNKNFVNNRPVLQSNPPVVPPAPAPVNEKVQVSPLVKDSGASQREPIFGQPLATSTLPPFKPAPTTQNAIRFQQFPNFGDQTGPILPPAGRPPSVSSSGSWGNAVVGSNSPALTNVINPARIPETTATPISGAFSPYQPFVSLPVLLQQPAASPTSNTPLKNPPLTLPTTSSTVAPAKTTLPPLSNFNFARPSGGYFPVGLPVSAPTGSEVPAKLAAASSALPPPPSPPKAPARPPISDPYSIINNPHFQGPSGSAGGYPQFVPKAPSASNSQSSAASASAPVTSPPSTSTLPPTTSAPIPTTPSTSAPKVASALSEMAKLPFYQEESFRPSALPPYIIKGSTTSENPEDGSFEETAPSTEQPFNELFSSSSNVSSIPTSSTLSPPKTGVPNLSVAEENDSAEEQPYPNFPPGKPVYWMNMYYPNGVPVLTKVTSSTPTPTSPKPRRRRTRSTTTTERITTPSEPEYYEEEDDVPSGGDGEKKARRKKKKPRNSGSSSEVTSTAATTQISI